MPNAGTGAAGLSGLVRTQILDLATGVYPDMREHGWATDAWPELFTRVITADILVIAGPIWLGRRAGAGQDVREVGVLTPGGGPRG